MSSHPLNVTANGLPRYFSAPTTGTILLIKLMFASHLLHTWLIIQTRHEHVILSKWVEVSLLAKIKWGRACKPRDYWLWHAKDARPGIPACTESHVCQLLRHGVSRKEQITTVSWSKWTIQSQIKLRYEMMNINWSNSIWMKSQAKPGSPSDCLTNRIYLAVRDKNN